MRCTRCKDRAAYCKGMCQRCYYATRRGSDPYFERLRRRNFIENDLGVLTDEPGHRWIVDLDDFEWCRGQLFNDNGSGYAKSRAGYLHKLLCPQWKTVDHINRDPFDCRRENLRDGSGGINAHNTPRARTKSPYRGVWRQHKIGRWGAGLQHLGVQYHLGTFDTPEQARDAYMAAKAALGLPDPECV